MKNLRTLLMLCAVSCFFLSFTYKAIPTKTIITGVINAKAPVTIKKIYFEFPDYITPVEIPVVVDNLGHFRLEIPLTHPTDFYINFEKGICKLMLYASPGDSTFIVINPDILNAGCSMRKLYSNVILTGRAQKINRDIAQFNIKFMQLIDWNELEISFVTLKPKKFKSYIEKENSKLLTFLKSFNVEQITCAEFQAWASSYIQFLSWTHLIHYAKDYSEFNKLNIDSFYKAMPKAYFNFLTELDNKINGAEISSTFFDFLEGLYEKNKIECSFGLNKGNNKYLQDLFLRYNNQIQQFHSQYLKDILFAKFYSKALDVNGVENVVEIYQPELIKDNILNMQIQKMLNDKKQK